MQPWFVILVSYANKLAIVSGTHGPAPAGRPKVGWYLHAMKLQRYNPTGPCRVSYGLPKALNMKKPAPTRAKMISTVQKRMTLTWILAGIILSKSGKTKNKMNKTLLHTLSKVVSESGQGFLTALW